MRHVGEGVGDDGNGDSAGFYNGGRDGNGYFCPDGLQGVRGDMWMYAWRWGARQRRERDRTDYGE